jgi:putative aminopeptidase FrvX
MESVEKAVNVWTEKIREYLACPSVVGYERPFLDKLEKEFLDLGLQVDKHHNLLFVQGNKPQSHIFSAHIDRHGLISNGKGELEYAAYRVKSLEYNEEKEMIEKFWDKVMERMGGEHMYAYDPESGEEVAEGKVKDCYLCRKRKNYIFLIDEMKNLPPNFPVSFNKECQVTGEKVSGQIDNTISVALAYTLYKMGYQGSFLFTTDEELGKSWQHIMACFKMQCIEEVQNLLVLDTTPFTEGTQTTHVNMDSVVFRKKDASGKFNEELAEKLRALALKHQIPHIFKDEWIESRTPEGKKPSLGKTELGMLATESEGKYNGATIQIPTLAYHSNNETATRKAMYNMMRMLTVLLEEG